MSSLGSFTFWEHENRCFSSFKDVVMLTRIYLLFIDYKNVYLKPKDRLRKIFYLQEICVKYGLTGALLLITIFGLFTLDLHVLLPPYKYFFYFDVS